MKRIFFRPVFVSILLYGCTTWTLTKLMEKKLNGMLRAILNMSKRQHLTKQQLYGHLPPITKTIRIRRTRYAGHCWINKDELVSEVLLWTPSHRRAKAGRPARTYIQQLCADTACSPEDLQKAMDDWEVWQERVRDIRADSVTWWWAENLSKEYLGCIFVWYSRPFLKWTREKLKQMDQKPRKLMTMRKALHPRDDVDWL